MDSAAGAGQGLLGVGIYTVQEAARLSGVSSGRIRRWMRGYKFPVKAAKGERAFAESPAVWHPDFQSDDFLALSFRDLMEVRFVDYFLDCGVRWRVLRASANMAAEIVGSTHPFSTKKFKTDGRRIYAALQERRADKKFLEVISGQFNMPEVLEARLYRGLVFASEEHVGRWYPMEPNRRIVIDPALSFGQPVVNPECVPVSVLVRAVNAEKSIARAAKWYGVQLRSVGAAVSYYNRLVA
jgi:uncharacterized protein (DUF433 family)